MTCSAHAGRAWVLACSYMVVFAMFLTEVPCSDTGRYCCYVCTQVVESSGLAPVGEVLIVPDLAAAVPWVGQPGDIMAPVDMVERDLSK